MNRLFSGGCILCGEVRRSGASPLCPACTEECRAISEPRCTRCGRSLVSEHGVCTDCRDRQDGSKNRAAVDYRGCLRELIALYKLSGRRELGALLAGLLVAGVGDALFGRTVVPVPASPARLKGLGWDPVLDLLRRVEKPLSIRIQPLLLRFPGPQQKELGYDERLLNAASLFGLRRNPMLSVGGPPEDPGARSVILFDDIFTTGATVSVCRGLLESAHLEVAGSATLAVD
jgi:predicted amidophosphoribosyltransferase